MHLSIDVDSISWPAILPRRRQGPINGLNVERRTSANL
jgi:hypothetical protein